MKRLVAIILSFLLGLFFLTGCAHEKKKEHDLFYDKWQQMAKESRGYSPEQRMESKVLEEEIVDTVDIQQDELGVSETAAKALPEKPVTIQIQTPTPIQEVLRLLAKGADQNIVISPKIKGMVTVNLKNVPWKDVFESILKNNGYTYVWEGDILRVLTLADLKQDQRLKESEAKRLQEQIQAQDVVRSVTQTKIVKIKYADIKKLQKTLIQTLGGESEEKDKQSDSSTLASGGSLASILANVDSSQMSNNQASNSSVSNSNIRMSAPKGTVIADESTNSLILRAGKKDMNMLMQLIRYLDQPPHQVHIKAHIVETTKETGRSLGIQWGGLAKTEGWDSGDNIWVTPGGTGGTTESDPQGGDYTSIFGSDEGTGEQDLGKGISGQGFGLNFPAGNEIGQGVGSAGTSLGFMVGEIGGNILEIQLSALEEENKAHILSRPSITTMDNQKAYLKSGAEVPYVSTGDEGDTNVEFKDAVLRLDITPHVIEKDLLKLDIKIAKDEVDLTRTVEGNPLITKRETETSLTVKSGETVVISGLSKETVGDSDKGVPWFKDVPGLGRLFKGETSSSQMEELLIFITPNILEKRSEVKKTVLDTELKPKQLERLKATGNPKAKDWVKQSKKSLQAENWQEALRTASIAIALDPGLPQAYFCRGKAYLKLGKDSQAYKDSSKLLYLEGQDSKSHLLRARILEEMGYQRKALQAYEKSCALGLQNGCNEHKRLFYKLQNK